MAQASSSPLQCEVIILTALPVEYKAVVQHLQNPQEVVHPTGTIYSLGNFVGQKRPWHVAVAEIGMGGIGAAAETEKAINHFHPEIALFVGIAGGLKDVTQGDVVVGTKIYTYESGKAGEHFQPRPEQGSASYALEQRARHEAHSDAWLTRIPDSIPEPAPTVWLGALAAGDKVLSDTHTPTYELIKEIYGDSLAVEMEGHGFLQAIRVNQTTLGLVVRGISDLVVDKSTPDTAIKQARAARHAAAFAFQVLATFTLTTTTSVSQTTTTPTQLTEGQRQRLTTRKAGLETTWETTNKRIQLVRQRLAVETDVSTILKYEDDISQDKARLEEIENQLTTIEQQLG